MATPVAESSARNDVELPPAVHWPTVYAMAGIGGGLVAVVIAVAVIAALQPAPPTPANEVAEIRPAPPPRPADAHPNIPALAVEAPANVSEPAAWTPLVPHNPAPVAAFSPPAPQVVTQFSPALAPAATPPPPWRSEPATEYDLFTDLQRHTRTVDLNTVKGTSDALLGKTSKDARAKDSLLPAPDETVAELIGRRPDLAGLPVRGRAECTKKGDEVKTVERVSQALQCVKFPQFPHPVPALDVAALNDDNPDPTASGKLLKCFDESQILDLVAKQGGVDLNEDHASVLAQMLQAEAPPIRLSLTKVLATIKGRPAGEALARQALFDLSSQVRAAAMSALRDRPPEEYRQTLLDGFRHPWPPVANHAAQALLEVNDQEAVPTLKTMLDLPDPAAPARNEKGKWEIAEVVKMSHLNNCLLCHAPSFRKDDPVPGLIPRAGKPLPEEYVGRCADGGDFVRADVTYLRQDFSVFEVVERPGKWPPHQRFDYMVRRRALTEQELSNGPSPNTKRWEPCPQREAVRYALEKLTAKKPDSSSQTTSPTPNATPFPSGAPGGKTP